MKYFILLYFFLFSITQSGHSQVYHYITNEILTNPAPYRFYMKNGTFKSYNADYYTFLIKYNKENFMQLPVIHVKSPSKLSKPPVFIFQGGPGMSNIWDNHFPAFLLDSFDIVMVGYKGVDGYPVIKNNQLVKLIQSNEFVLENNEIINYANAFRDSMDKVFSNGFFSFTQYCTDIYLISNALQINTFHLFGYSYGGFIIQCFAQMYPSKVSSLMFAAARPLNAILLNPQQSSVSEITAKFHLTFQKTEFTEKQNIALFHVLYDPNLIVQLLNLNTIELRKMYLDRMFSEAYTRNVFFADFFIKIPCLSEPGMMDNNSHLNNNPGNLEDIFNAWIETGANPNIANINQEANPVKTAWICGEFDILSPPSLFINASQYYPHAKCFVIKNTFHAGMADMNRYADVIRDFLCQYP